MNFTIEPLDSTMSIQEKISKKGFQLRMNLTNGRIGSYSAVKNGKVYATDKTQTKLLKSVSIK